MNCDACASDEMADRGVLGGLHWHQCRHCGHWSHYRPDPYESGGINPREGEAPEEDSDAVV